MYFFIYMPLHVIIHEFQHLETWPNVAKINPVHKVV